MKPNQYAELISLALTAPTIILGCVTVYIFWSPARRALLRNNRSAVEWFAMGIFFGFVGSIADNLYWSIPWTLSFIGEPVQATADFFFKNGVFANIIFRQTAGILAGYCHIRAALKYDDESLVNKLEREQLHRGLIISTIIGLILTLILVMLRSWIYD